MSESQLAHFNLARMRGSLESEVMTEFVAQLPLINAVADAAPGFVWRMIEEDPADPALLALGPLMLVNLSVWRDVQALSHYVYRSAHLGVLKDRGRWFHPLQGANAVLWWVPAGHIPTLAEASARLAQLNTEGPSALAFTFRQPYEPPRGANDT